MNENCNEFEKMFIFSNKEKLNEHAQNCPECKKELEKFEKVSELLQEVKPYYIKQKAKQKRKLVAVCAAFCMILISATSCYVINDTGITDSIMYGNETAEELGFPVDSDGLLMVDE